MPKAAAEVVAAAGVEAAQAVPVAQVLVLVLVAQAREPVVVQAQQAERVRGQLSEEGNKERALEVLAKEELRTLTGRVIPLTRQTGRFRDGLRHKIHLQHLERTGSTDED